VYCGGGSARASSRKLGGMDVWRKGEDARELLWGAQFPRMKEPEIPLPFSGEAQGIQQKGKPKR